MATLLMVGLLIIAGVAGKLHHNFGLPRLSHNDTGCMGDPHGDRLKDLCATPEGIICCLYTDYSRGPGLRLAISGGDDKFLRTLLPQLPADNITYLALYNTDLFAQDSSLCLLSNLQMLFAQYTGLQRFNCLSQLRDIEIISSSFGMASFRGLDHLSWVSITAKQFYLFAPDAMFQFQAAKELTYLELQTYDLTALDIWPLCLAQTHPGIQIVLRQNPIVDFENTIRPPRCNIEAPLMANAEIILDLDAITHVSDIATGWGFPSLHHFITSLMRGDSTDFPIELGDNPFRCDCRDLDLYRILRDPQYSLHLANLVNLTCDLPDKLKGRRFGTLLDSELDCDSPPLPLILGVSIGGAALLVISLLGFLFYNRIRLYRWSGYKLHPWDRDECIGENKEFDVFVSHASEDEAWTLELIEDLESHGFKVLFHKKDFQVGVTKIENIMMAVDKSKRTICVLSPSFVASPWCSWEFITVFNDDIEEHQRRLLLVVKERVAWESLSLAMQRYMRDFTYINAASPYFMDNLLYSLPVERLGEAREERDSQFATSDATARSSAGERTPLLQSV